MIRWKAMTGPGLPCNDQVVKASEGPVVLLIRVEGGEASCDWSSGAAQFVDGGRVGADGFL
jgi:hypothetical protein